jgi:hypothetical protein
VVHVCRATELRACVWTHLTSTDSAAQALALRCLVHFPSPPLPLSRYLQVLVALTEPRTLKATLARLPLDADAPGGIPPPDRPSILPLTLRLLFPLMRKRSGRLAGRGAPGSARSAILNKLAALAPVELVPLLELFIDPLATAFRPTPSGWVARLLEGGMEEWLERVDAVALATAPLARRRGAANALGDLFSHLGFRMEPFLPALAALAMALFEAAVAGAAAGAEGEKAARSHTLRLISAMLERFPTGTDWRPFWPRLLPAVASLAAHLPAAAARAVAAPPPLLALIGALAGDPHLVPVLANHDSLATLPPGWGASGEEEGTLAAAEPPAALLPHCSAAWAAAAQGSALLHAAVAALRAARAAPAARTAALSAIEHIVASGDAAVALVLAPAADDLADAVRVLLDTPGGGAPGREVMLLERVCRHVHGGASADGLATALVAAATSRRTRDGLAALALRALTGLWLRPSGSDSPAAAAAAEAAAWRLAPLAAGRGALRVRAALPGTLDALAGRVAALGAAIVPLRGATAEAGGLSGEVDVDSRLATYATFTVATWAAFPPLSAAVLMHATLHDALSPDDLALRSSAAAALTRFVATAATSSHLRPLATGTFYHALLRHLSTAPPLPVRQELLVLTQRLVSGLPDAFPDAVVLTHTDPEADFFFNVAHIQLHRRTRALQRLQSILQDAQVLFQRHYHCHSVPGC